MPGLVTCEGGVFQTPAPPADAGGRKLRRRLRTKISARPGPAEPACRRRLRTKIQVDCWRIGLIVCGSVCLRIGFD